MTFSATKIGTIEQVRETLRDHHSIATESGDRVHNRAVNCAIEELKYIELEGFKYACVSISGNHYSIEGEDPEQRSISMAYNVSAYSLTETQFKKRFPAEYAKLTGETTEDSIKEE